MARNSHSRRMVPPSQEEARWENPALLGHLETLRKPLQSLNREIACWTLRDCFTREELRRGSFVEIGAGAGQLRHWLPQELLPQVLHTEPSRKYAQTFQRNHPLANFTRCRAERLPCESDSQTGLLGLCVLDSVTDALVTQREIHRVLKPGGKVVHFLDLGANAVQLFVRLIQRNLLPLPNFLQDQDLMQVTGPLQKRHLPAITIEHDLLLTDLDEFQHLLENLAAHRHPAARVLQPYVSHFLQEPVSTASAADAFLKLTSHPQQLALFNKHLLAVYLAVQGEENGELGTFEVIPFASVREFEQVLQKLFSTAAGFEVERCQLLTARSAVKRSADLLPEIRYSGHCTGRRMLGRRLAQPSPGLVVHETPEVVEWLKAPRSAPADGMILESGILVFVARKRA